MPSTVINFQCRALHSSPRWQKKPLHTWNHQCNSLYIIHWIFRLKVLDGVCALWVITVSLTKFWLQLCDRKLCPWKCIHIPGFSLFQLLLLLVFRKTFVSAEGRIHHHEMPRFVFTELQGLWFWPFHLCCLDCFWITMYSLFLSNSLVSNSLVDSFSCPSSGAHSTIICVSSLTWY